MRLVLGIGVCSFVALSLGSSCAHTVTNEERLDGMTDVVVDSTEDAHELRCRDASPEVQIARDRSQRKAERLARYTDAIADAKETQGRFDEAFRKDPDLLYGPKADEWKRRSQFCAELAVTLEREKSRVDVEVVEAVAEKPAPAAAPVKKAPVVVEEKKEASASAASADEAFEDDADQLRSSYKKKAKVAKASKKKKKSKKHATLATR